MHLGRIDGPMLAANTEGRMTATMTNAGGNTLIMFHLCLCGGTATDDIDQLDEGSLDSSGTGLRGHFEVASAVRNGRMAG
jgi:hypothetical protein